MYIALHQGQRGQQDVLLFESRIKAVTVGSNESFDFRKKETASPDNPAGDEGTDLADCLQLCDKAKILCKTGTLWRDLESAATSETKLPPVGWRSAAAALE